MIRTVAWFSLEKPNEDKTRSDTENFLVCRPKMKNELEKESY